MLLETRMGTAHYGAVDDGDQQEHESGTRVPRVRKRVAKGVYTGAVLPAIRRTLGKHLNSDGSVQPAITVLGPFKAGWRDKFSPEGAQVTVITAHNRRADAHAKLVRYAEALAEELSGIGRITFERGHPQLMQQTIQRQERGGMIVEHVHVATQTFRIGFLPKTAGV